MPPKHREFLIAVTKGPSIRKYGKYLSDSSAVNSTVQWLSSPSLIPCRKDWHFYAFRKTYFRSCLENIQIQVRQDDLDKYGHKGEQFEVGQHLRYRP